MLGRVSTSLLLLLGTLSSAGNAETVTFASSSTTLFGRSFNLTGMLTKPEGDGRFPAVVMLHGCSGVQNREDTWAERLADWGYVVLRVDSFSPRGRGNVCGYPSAIPPAIRKRDARDALSYLGGLPFVDRERVGLIGWSHGAWTALHAISGSWESRLEEQGVLFRAVVAFYPYCDVPLEGLSSPLLILIGEQDDWCPAYRCSQMMPKKSEGSEVLLKIYPGAYHDFDWEGMDKIYEGHRLLYDPSASDDSIVRVKEFLANHLQ